MKKTAKQSAAILALTLVLCMFAGCAASAGTAAFSLHGYAGHVGSYDYHTYIENAEVKLEKDATALDVVAAGLAAEGYTFSDESYIYTVIAPDGMVMNAGDLGENSGWLFAVNGVIPDTGIAEYAVKAGDSVELRYVAHFNTEVDWETGTFIVQSQD